MAILVTGGTGYIGSHTVVESFNNNFDVVILDWGGMDKFIHPGVAKHSGDKGMEIFADRIYQAIMDMINI